MGPVNVAIPANWPMAPHETAITSAKFGPRSVFLTSHRLLIQGEAFDIIPLNNLGMITVQHLRRPSHYWWGGVLYALAGVALGASHLLEGQGLYVTPGQATVVAIMSVAGGIIALATARGPWTVMAHGLAGQVLWRQQVGARCRADAERFASAVSVTAVRLEAYPAGARGDV